MNNDADRGFESIAGVFTTTEDNFRDERDIFIMAEAFWRIESMTHKKLQKLCYYAKAWYLALYDRNIVADQFEAWVHGAVQPDLYQRYKSYGFNYITESNFHNKVIPEEFISFAREIYEAYGELSGDELEKINHSELPWLNARKGYKPWESCNNIISEEDMKSYYRELLEDE